MVNLITKCNAVNDIVNHQSGTEAHSLAADQWQASPDTQRKIDEPVSSSSVTDEGLEIFNGIEVTKLPAGEAYGARDMQKWSLRRMKGQSGVPEIRKKRKQLTKRSKPGAADRWLAKHKQKRR